MPVIASYQGEIAAQLPEFRSKGQKEAAKHRPPSDSTHPDSNETALQIEAERWIGDEQRLFDITTTEAGKTAIDVRQKAIELQMKVDQLVSDTSLQSTIEADMSGDRQALISATESRLKAEVDWKAFRAFNGISEQASYPESRIWHLAVVASFALLETLMNAFFFENAQGLMGGFTVALGIAVINMCGAMALGYGFTFKNLAAPDKKAIGWASLIFFVVFSVYCNALFASFRAEYQMLVDPSEVAQLRQAFSNSFAEAKKVFLLDMHVADLMSFILFGVGLLLSLLAFYKGYTLDDRYPGHGKRDRTRVAMRQIEIERQELLRQRVKDFLHQRRGEVQGVIHEPAQLIGRVSTRIADLQHAQATLKAQAQAIQRDFSLVLGAYRSANTAVRATEPPEYFKLVPDVAHRVTPAAADELLADLALAQEELKSLRERNQESLAQRQKQLQGDVAEILSKTFNQFLADIEVEARNQIDRNVQVIHRAVRAEA